MIIECKDCLSKFNNETVDKCPMCKEAHYNPKHAKMTLSQKKRQMASNVSRQIKNFIREDRITKNITARGYHHRKKTGGPTI